MTTNLQLVLSGLIHGFVTTATHSRVKCLSTVKNQDKMQHINSNVHLQY